MFKKRMKLTREEKRIDDALMRGEYVNVPKEEFDRIKRALDARKRQVVVSIRINPEDLRILKQKAVKQGIRLESFIVEILHRVAMS